MTAKEKKTLATRAPTPNPEKWYLKEELINMDQLKETKLNAPALQEDDTPLFDPMAAVGDA